MTKAERFRALKRTLKPLLTRWEYIQAVTLLHLFRYVFTMQKKAKASSGVKKWFYILVALKPLKDGYKLDLLLNECIGEKLFGKYKDGKTITDTLKNVKKVCWANTGVMSTGAKVYLGATPGQCALAIQICETLNMYDPGHC